MNIADLQKKLLAAARSNPPSDAVPYGFERRVMSRLISQPKIDGWTFWGLALWRVVAPYVAVMLVVGAWTYFSGRHNGETLDVALENTLVAPLDNGGDIW